MGAVHSLRVKSSYQLLKIENIETENKPNEHGYLYLKCLIDDSINFQSTINASTDDKIFVYEEQEDETISTSSDESPIDINVVNESNSKLLFSGIVQNVRTSNVNGIYYLEIQALTVSFELDIKEKSRSFQNADMTYDELIGTILKDYSGANFSQCIGNGEKIGKPLFQYKETDWSFIKRIASELKSELYCDIIDIRNMFYFGRPSNGSYDIEDVTNYRAYKNLKRFHEAGGYDEGYHDIDYFYYEIESREKYQVGDDISIKDKHLYVNQYSTYAIKDEVIYKYRLCRKNGVWQTKLYNSLIGGASLEGNVLAVEGEKVKLHLDIDETQNEAEASWFPYAPPTGNVMYSMPIVGTSARLYFPNESSEEPIITGCVRTNGSSCGKTADTTNRYFGTEHGSEIEMTPGALNIKGGSKEPLSISFDDKIGVTLKSPKNLNLNADDDIIIKTPASIKVKAQSQIGVTKAGTENGFSVETDMHFKGGNVIKDGSDREAFAPFDDEPKAGTKPEPPAPPPEEKKPFNWGKLATNVLAGLAVVALVAVAAVAIAVTLGAAAPVIGAIAVGAAVAGTAAVASQAISDVQRGEVSDMSTYMAVGAREAFIGAVSGAIFGPFGATEALGGKMLLGGVTNGAESILRQTLNGESINWGTVLFDVGIGAATGGAFHGAGKLFEKASPFAKKAFNKISSEISENTRIAKIALNNMEKGPKSVVLGSNLGNVDEALGRFTKEFKKVKNEINLEPKRMDAVIEVPEFNVKPKFNNDVELKNEYTRQVKGQEEGLNKLSIKEYLDNREAYANRLEEQKLSGKKNPSGRDPKASAQQQWVRNEAIKDKIKEYTKQGLSRKEAKEKANAWIKTQAALHDPDQIAGGNPLNVTGMGDNRINSSIGSQWKSMAGDVEKQVRKYIEDNNLSEKDLEKIYLNIKLSCGGK